MLPARTVSGVRVFYLDEQSDESEPQLLPYASGDPLPIVGDVIEDHCCRTDPRSVQRFRVLSRWFNYYATVLVVTLSVVRIEDGES